MKTHLIIDTFFCPGDVVYIGTKEECEERLPLVSLLSKGLQVIEMTTEEKEFYN